MKSNDRCTVRLDDDFDAAAALNQEIASAFSLRVEGGITPTILRDAWFVDEEDEPQFVTLLRREQSAIGRCIGLP
jgi:hypothetical protein